FLERRKQRRRFPAGKAHALGTELVWERAGFSDLRASSELGEDVLALHRTGEQGEAIIEVFRARGPVERGCSPVGLDRAFAARRASTSKPPSTSASRVTG